MYVKFRFNWLFYSVTLAWARIQSSEIFEAPMDTMIADQNFIDARHSFNVQTIFLAFKNYVAKEHIKLVL